jgi:beta-glucanase (GH16 family)
MQPKQLLLRIAVIASILAQSVLTLFAATPVLAAGLPLVDDFETGLPAWFAGAGSNLSGDSVYVTAPVSPLAVGFNTIDYKVTEGAAAIVTANLSSPSTDLVTVNYVTKLGNAVPNRDYTPQLGTLTFAPNVMQQSFTVPTFDDAKYQGERSLLVELSAPTSGAALGLPPVARVAILDNETYDFTLIDDFETFPYLWWGDKKITLDNPEIAAGSALALPGQGAYEHVLSVDHKNGSGAYEFGRTFPTPQDWSDSVGLHFWWYGQNSGREVQVKLANNQAASAVADRAQWHLLWSDEFDGKAGSLPNPNVWGYEIGDGTANGIPGWGNDELEYYTNNPDNVATDGRGNLVITARQADGSLMCYYGPCRYTSARLLTKNRFEVAYGRVEARVKVPRGAGLWPAFWMLGTDIDRVFWPQTGEIDIMEYVGRLPNKVFGTIHGPGYSGGQSYGKSYDLGKPLADAFHTFAVEWQPDKIIWYIDGIPYHQATSSDPFLQGKQWVFNHPFFMLLNVAVGGNFGGAVGPNTTFPQATLVDFVRLYQARPHPVEFKASFRDNFAGWQRVTLPFTAFKGGDGRSPDLAKVHSLAFKVPGSMRGPVLLDQVRLVCSDQVTVSTTADSGAGSLRKALGSVCAGGTVAFAPTLGGQTITLTSGAITLGKNVTVDAAAPGLTVSGSNRDRVFIVNSGTTATIRNLTLANGYGFELAGGVLNNGVLTLDRVVLANNRVTTSGNDFWKGGGAIYNGDGSKLALVDSTVRNNSVTGGAGGGVYGFFNTTVSIERSTISGNTADDVGGGIRSLGNFTIVNSTISGNSSTGWHGGGFFHTDGVMNIVNSTIANNTAPDGTSGGGFVGTFTGGDATLTLANTIVAGNSGDQCFYAPFGNGDVRLVSLGHNVATDITCAIPHPVASDRIVADALLGPLADNGGPTPTHALLPGSPAHDAADAAFCLALDQRGAPRPQGAACDAGSYEAITAQVGTVDARIEDASTVDASPGDAGPLQSLPEGTMFFFLPLVQN